MEAKIDNKIFLEHSRTDIHRRGKACVRTIQWIEKNEIQERTNNGQVPHKLKRIRKLSEHNQKVVLEYAKDMALEVETEKRSLASFEKNLNEWWLFCLSWNKDLDKATLNRKDMLEWWNETRKGYYSWLKEKRKPESKQNIVEGMISHGTLRKRYECVSTSLKWFYGLKKKQVLEVFLDVELDSAPVFDNKIKQPTSKDIKTLINSILLDGRVMSYRDATIALLMYDVGSRQEPLMMRESDIWKPEGKQYYCIHFPESKSVPRTVISYLAREMLTKWIEMRPGGYNPNGDRYLFCKEDGVSHASYASVSKSFYRGLKKSGIPWKKGKALHYMRTLWNTRARHWGYIERFRFLGRKLKGSEESYVEIPPEQFEKSYFEMLKEEKNAFLSPEDLGIVEDKTSVYTNKAQQEDMLNVLIEGRLEDIEKKMVEKLLARQMVKT